MSDLENNGEWQNILKTLEVQHREEKNAAYRERNQLVWVLCKLALAFGWKVWTARHKGADWEDDWRTVIFIQLPTGQVSWHVHDSEQAAFEALISDKELMEWDGHSTPEKYERLKEVDWNEVIERIYCNGMRVAGQLRKDR